MRPGDRVTAIQRIASALSVMDWPDIELVLSQFGFPTNDMWNGGGDDPRRAYAMDMLRAGSDGELLELDDHLSGVTATEPGDHPWELGRFRLFLSHLATEKIFATALRDGLAYYGVQAFVAHVDIEPMREWQRVIEAALQSCDALVALLHPAFGESKWTDQEVGYAVGLGRPVLAVRLGCDPYGFMGHVQALPGNGNPDVLSLRIVQSLWAEPRVTESLTDAVVTRLEGSNSFDQSNGLSTLLAAHPDAVTARHLDRLRDASSANSQIRQSFDFDRNFSRIEQHHIGQGRTITEASPLADEPF